MKHPIWGPICWKILSRLMHVHKPVFYAKALTTPSWPICSLFIYPIFCLSSISLSLVLWQHVSHHISVGCLDLSHWCLSHKRMLMSVPFCTVCDTLLSTWVLLCSPKPTAIVRRVHFSESTHVSSAEHVLFSILWRRCTRETDRMVWGKVKEPIWVRYVPPRQRSAERGA